MNKKWKKILYLSLGALGLFSISFGFSLIASYYFAIGNTWWSVPSTIFSSFIVIFSMIGAIYCGVRVAYEAEESEI